METATETVPVMATAMVMVTVMVTATATETVPAMVMATVTGTRPGNGNGGNGNNNVIINNPVMGGGGYYGWNGGMAWYPAPYYWGGGFWGAWTIGLTSAAVYGSVVDEEDDVTYNSYEVQQGTPGATFLTNYQLVQVKCGLTGLVVVYGPGEQRHLRESEQLCRRRHRTGSTPSRCR